MAHPANDYQNADLPHDTFATLVVPKEGPAKDSRPFEQKRYISVPLNDLRQVVGAPGLQSTLQISAVGPPGAHPSTRTLRKNG